MRSKLLLSIMFSISSVCVAQGTATLDFPDTDSVFQNYAAADQNKAFHERLGTKAEVDKFTARRRLSDQNTPRIAEKGSGSFYQGVSSETELNAIREGVIVAQLRYFDVSSRPADGLFREEEVERRAVYFIDPDLTPAQITYVTDRLLSKAKWVGSNFEIFPNDLSEQQKKAAMSIVESRRSSCGLLSMLMGSARI